MFQGSPSFSFSKSDLMSVLKGLCLAIAAAALTFLIDIVIPSLQERPGVNLAIVSFIAAGLNALRKFVFDTQETVRKISPLLVASLLLVGSSMTYAQEPKPPLAGPASPPPRAVAVTPVVDTETGVPTARRDLTYQKRRELGMTPGSMNATVEELIQDGKVTDSSSNSEVAMLVLSRIRKGNRKAFDGGGYDWEACLGFIEIWYSEVRE